RRSGGALAEGETSAGAAAGRDTAAADAAGRADAVDADAARAPTPSMPTPSMPPAAPAKRLRGDLDNIVMKALEKEPERRYPTVGDFREDLRRFRHDLPVQARRPTLRYRAGRFVRRHAAGVA